MSSRKALVILVSLLGLFSLSLVDVVSDPPGAVEPYFNGVFSDVTPGFGGSWYLEEELDQIDIIAPLRIIDFPGTDDVLVLCKTGRVWQLDLESQEQTLLLDISARTLNYSESGAVSFVLHPEFGNPAFPDKQDLFVFYRYKPSAGDYDDHLGFNRLSRFPWNPAIQAFNEATEEILIQQYDRSAWHNGGGLFFNDGFLHISLGDEGSTDEQRNASAQKIDGGLFSGVLRIDVDNDPDRSHPIRRQPTEYGEIPAEWTERTFTQGYSIPNDNPFVNEDGSVLEEYYAIGIRSPYSTWFDPIERNIWLSDVGSSRFEEINLVEKGDNLQWDYLEGDVWGGASRPAEIIGNDKAPLFQYSDEVGGCVIGGGVYRGSRFLYLDGKFVFADYNTNKILALTQQSDTTAEVEVLLTDFGPEPIDNQDDSAISGIHFTADGHILITIIDWPYRDGGKILHLRQRDPVPDPPARLSELGVFTDLQALETAPGIFPYRVNAPLWSDRAAKRRWMAVPNNGDFDRPEEQIDFSEEGNWTFPEGTVFIKHFDLPQDLSNPNNLTKLETRFFIVGKNNQAYGLTYKWNEEQTDAFLQLGASTETFDLFEDGEVVGTQSWDYPGRDQCMTCHNANADFVLGVKTHQLNGDITYPGATVQENQLKYLSDHGIIRHDYQVANPYPRAYAIDNEAAPLGERIRSYLDANCASCHQPGGIGGLTMDLRYHTPLEAKNIISLPTLSHGSVHDNLIVEPGYHADSELWIRDQSLDDNRMPPLGTKLVDQVYVDALAEWIDGLDEEHAPIETFLAFPNPSDGYLILRATANWELPLRVEVFRMNGQLAHEERLEDHLTHLRLQRVGRGVFALRVTDARGETSTEQIVIR